MNRQLAFVILMVFMSCAMSGQPAGGPAFEVATIRPVPPPTGRVARAGPNGGPGTRDPGLYTCTFCELTPLILQAYDMKELPAFGAELDSKRAVRHQREGAGRRHQGTVRADAAPSVGGPL